MSEEKLSSHEISFSELRRRINSLYGVLMKRWYILVLFGLIGFSAGFYYAYHKPPTYKAILSFALEDDKNSSIGGAAGLASQLGFDVGSSAGGAFAGSNLIELMKSRNLIEKALRSKIKFGGREQTLAASYMKFNNWDSKFLTSSGTEQYASVRQADSVYGEMYEKITKDNLNVAQRDKKIGVIYVEVSSADEFFSKTFAEELVNIVSDFYIDTKSKKAKKNVSILEKQRDSIQQALTRAISGVAIANDNVFNLNPAYNIQRVPSLRRQVDVQSNTVILTEIVKNLELAKMTLLKETPLIQIIDSPKYPLKKSRVSRSLGALAGGVFATFLAVVLILIMKPKTNRSKEGN